MYFPLRTSFAASIKFSTIVVSFSFVCRYFLISSLTSLVIHLFFCRSGGCAGTGGPRGAIPHWRSGIVVVRRYSSSKVRNSGCALLEQPWRDTPCQGKRNPSKMVSVARGHQRADTLIQNHRKLVNIITLGPEPCLTQCNQAMPVGQPKTGGWWWRGLTECGPLEKGMANHFNILALRTQWRVWKGKMIGYQKRNSPGH